MHCGEGGRVRGGGGQVCVCACVCVCARAHARASAHLKALPKGLMEHEAHISQPQVAPPRHVVQLEGHVRQAGGVLQAHDPGIHQEGAEGDAIQAILHDQEDPALQGPGLGLEAQQLRQLALCHAPSHAPLGVAVRQEQAPQLALTQQQLRAQGMEAGLQQGIGAGVEGEAAGQDGAHWEGGRERQCSQREWWGGRARESLGRQVLSVEVARRHWRKT